MKTIAIDCYLTKQSEYKDEPDSKLEQDVDRNRPRETGFEVEGKMSQISPSRFLNKNRNWKKWKWKWKKMKIVIRTGSRKNKL